MTGLVALCIVFIAANTASMAVRERVGEIAVLKALGFRWRLLFGTLVLEAAILRRARRRASACSLAFSLSRVRSAGAAGWNPQLGPLGGFIVTHAIVVQGLFLALFVGILSGVVPALGRRAPERRRTLREVF